MAEIVVFVTTSSEEEASKIARELVEQRLVACANILGRVRSVFSWEGKVADEQEALMVLKTQDHRFDKLSHKIKELHSYSVPEIIAIPISKGLPEYLQWVRNLTDSDPPARR